MRIIEPTYNIAVENYTEVLSKGEGDSKIIIEANIKATADNLILSMAAIMIIIIAIIEVKVAMAMEETIIEHMVTEEAITEATTIINTINTTRMMMDPSSNNMVHHVHFVVVSTILFNIVLREKMTSIISWRK